MTWIAPAQGLPRDFAAGLTPAEVVALTHDPRAWLRPDQRIPDYAWRVWALICGRGWGKSHAAATWLLGRVQAHGHEKAQVILGAPNEHRIRDIQIKALIDESPPWFKAELKHEGVIWPNGTRAIGFTPEAPERPRGANAMAAWLTEHCDYPPRNIMAFFQNVSLGTRINPYGGQIVLDTTNKAGNLLSAYLQEMNARDPSTFVIQGGTMFDNPLLTREYLRSQFALYGSETNRRYREEVLGEIFSEAAGALFTQAQLNANRLAQRRPSYDRILVGVDPSQSARPDADDAGIVVAGAAARDVDVLEDLSGHYTPAQVAQIAVAACIDEGAAGIVAETNNIGTAILELIKVACDARNVKYQLLADTRGHRNEPFPARTPGRIYVREIRARESKHVRAEGPAALCEAGRLHMVGTYPELETELVTFEPGVTKSPNRYDAMMHVVAELADLRRDSRDEAPPPMTDAGRDALRARLRGIGRGGRIL